MAWLFQSKLQKSHFYVWYLGSKEADGVRGSAVVLPIMRQLLKESFKKTPSKATVQIQISSKGLKLIQSVPAVSRSGKVKMQLVKFQIAANCITYSMMGKAPFDDVIGVVMLVLNPEMHCPMHVHCYRCDSSETAQIMHANLQVLLSRPDVQRSILDLEHRLFLSGLLLPRSRAENASLCASRRTTTDEIACSVERVTAEEKRREKRRMKIFDESAENIVNYRNDGRSSTDTSKREFNMPRKVVEELKNKLIKGSDGTHTKHVYGLDPVVRASLTDLPTHGAQYRMFGDTLMRGGKSLSLDNIAEPNIVSTNLCGSSSRPQSHQFGSNEQFPHTSRWTSRNLLNL